MASIKNKFLRFVLIFIAFFTLKSANANHELGGEITYNYIGNKKYGSIALKSWNQSKPSVCSPGY